MATNRILMRRRRGRTIERNGAAPSARKGEGGFSLIEIIAALAIFALSAGAILNSVALSSRASFTSSGYAAALAAAESRLAAATADPQARLGAEEGLDSAGRIWRLTIEPQNSDREDPEFALYRMVRFSVEIWFDGDRRTGRRVALSTARLRVIEP